MIFPWTVRPVIKELAELVKTAECRRNPFSENIFRVEGEPRIVIFTGFAAQVFEPETILLTMAELKLIRRSLKENPSLLPPQKQDPIAVLQATIKAHRK